jgi:type IV secretory pathway VirB10-like protein
LAREEFTYMEISKSVLGAVGALCIAAGATGAYLGSRTSEAAPIAASETLAISPDPAAAIVDQSEAIVTDAPAPDVAAPAPVERARPAAAPRSPVRAAAREPQWTTGRPAPQVIPVDGPAPAPQEQRVISPPALEAVRVSDPEPPRPVEPPAPQFEELVVEADSVVGLQVETNVSSEQARVEDEIVARVTRDVRVGDRVAIPAGSKAYGEVTLVERGGRLKDRARLGIRFTSVVLADGTRVPLETETIFREGSAPGGESAAKIGGGAIGGAIIGGILGGAKGAAIGAGVGAGGGTAAVMAGGRNPATLPNGTPITVRVTQPTTVTVEK